MTTEHRHAFTEFVPGDQGLLEGGPPTKLEVGRQPVLRAAPVTRRSSETFGPERQRGQESRWLLHGVGPYLIFGDTCAFLLPFALSVNPSWWQVVLLVMIYVATFAVAGLYRSRLNLSLLDDFPYMVAAVVVGATIETSVFAFLAPDDPQSRQVSHAAVLLTAVILVRFTAYLVVRQARSRGLVRHRTLIVGADKVGVRLALSMLEHRYYGLDPIGFVESENSDDRVALPAPMLGSYLNLSEIVERYRIRNVVVAFGNASEAELIDVISTCKRLGVIVFFVPRVHELHNAKRDADALWGIPLVRSRRAAWRTPCWRLKRPMDIAVSGTALLVLSPVLALCALAVRCEGGRGVIFRQERVGLDGKPFQVLKFRSMTPLNEVDSQTTWNIKGDRRVGPIGRFLRQTSLDELPQLWNILRGDMSLVGPRPERPHFVNQFSTHIPRYTARHRVPVGLTGWAQAHGLRGDTSIEDRARFDNYYIENWSLWLDTKIVIKTLGQVLRRQGG